MAVENMKTDGTKISENKLKLFIERLNKIGVEITLSSNIPWVYIDKICGQRVTEIFYADHGFNIMFLPIMNDSPPAKFTNIKEIFKLIRKYKN